MQPLTNAMDTPTGKGVFKRVWVSLVFLSGRQVHTHTRLCFLQTNFKAGTLRGNAWDTVSRPALFACLG